MSTDVSPKNTNASPNGMDVRLRDPWSRARTLTLALLGVVLIFIAAIVDDFTRSNATSFAAWYMRPEMWANIARELGFACLIALVVGVFIEKSVRESEAREAKKRIESIAEAVFSAVLKSQVPEQILSHALKILQSSVIREKMIFHVHLTRRSENSDGDNIEFIQLDRNMSYELKNVTDTVRIQPIELLIPKPFDNGLAAYACAVDGIKVTFDDHELDADEKKAAEQQSAVSTESIVRYQWNRRIPPKGTLRVRLRDHTIKALSGHEIWRCLIPTSGFQLHIHVQSPGLQVNVTGPNGDAPQMLVDANVFPDGTFMGEREYEIQEPMLTFQTIDISWHTVRDMQTSVTGMLRDSSGPKQ